MSPGAQAHVVELAPSPFFWTSFGLLTEPPAAQPSKRDGHDGVGQGHYASCAQLSWAVDGSRRRTGLGLDVGVLLKLLANFCLVHMIAHSTGALHRRDHIRIE